MEKFILGVLASLIGGFVLAVLGVLEKWIPFLEFNNIGVMKIFKDQNHATNSISEEIEKSKILYVLAMQGSSFSNPEKPLSKVLSNTGIKQRYLISTLENSYLKKRGKELKMDMAHSVNLSVANFKKAQEANSSIQIERHNEVVRFRIILLSDFLYLSFQKVSIPGKESSILKISNSSPMYLSFSSLFNDLWENYCKKNKI